MMIKKTVSIPALSFDPEVTATIAGYPYSPESLQILGVEWMSTRGFPTDFPKLLSWACKMNLNPDELLIKGWSDYFLSPFVCHKDPDFQQLSLLLEPTPCKLLDKIEKEIKEVLDADNWTKACDSLKLLQLSNIPHFEKETFLFDRVRIFISHRVQAIQAYLVEKNYCDANLLKNLFEFQASLPNEGQLGKRIHKFCEKIKKDPLYLIFNTLYTRDPSRYSDHSHWMPEVKGILEDFEQIDFPNIFPKGINQTAIFSKILEPDAHLDTFVCLETLKDYGNKEFMAYELKINDADRYLCAVYEAQNERTIILSKTHYLLEGHDTEKYKKKAKAVLSGQILFNKSKFYIVTKDSLKRSTLEGILSTVVLSPVKKPSEERVVPLLKIYSSQDPIRDSSSIAIYLQIVISIIQNSHKDTLNRENFYKGFIKELLSKNGDLQWPETLSDIPLDKLWKKKIFLILDWLKDIKRELDPLNNDVSESWQEKLDKYRDEKIAYLQEAETKEKKSFEGRFYIAYLLLPLDQKMDIQKASNPNVVSKEGEFKPTIEKNVAVTESKKQIPGDLSVIKKRKKGVERITLYQMFIRGMVALGLAYMLFYRSMSQHSRESMTSRFKLDNPYPLRSTDTEVVLRHLEYLENHYNDNSPSVQDGLGLVSLFESPNPNFAEKSHYIPVPKWNPGTKSVPVGVV